MANTRVLILEGPNGQSFFLKETLLAEGLADRIHLISQARQAIDLLRCLPYDLIVINLVEAWEQGLQLSLWLSQYTSACPTILIIPSDLDRPLPANGSFIILTEPLSLHDFAARARAALEPNDEPTAHIIPVENAAEPLNSLTWSGGPINQEYSGYWSHYTHSLFC